MGAKGGKLPGSQVPQAVRQLRVGQSSLGQVIPIVYGENRLAYNLIFADWFTAISHTGGPAMSGKGATAPFVQFTYTVSAILALAEGVLVANPAIPCSVPQQTMQVGRATPGGQVLTISDHTGAQTAPQPTVGIEPGTWRGKKTRRVVDDKGSGVYKDGDDKDLKPFRPARFHNWERDSPSTIKRYISGVQDGTYDIMNTAFKNAASPNPDQRPQPQHTTYIGEANENYPGIACIVRQNMRLGSTASIPAWNFPLRGLMQYDDIYGFAPAGQHDADPACIVMDLLTNPKHGAGWDRDAYQKSLSGWPYPWGAKLSITSTPALPQNSWSAYCRAQNLLLSPIYDTQTPMTDILRGLAEETDTAVIWSEGQLKMIPYGNSIMSSADTATVFTPSTDPTDTSPGANLGVRYNLNTDVFLPGNNGDSIEVERRPITPGYQTDYKSDGLYNHVQIEFTNAANGYAVEIADIKDEASIADVGEVPHQPYQLHEIRSPSLASDVARRLLSRLVVVRNVYHFSLDWRFCLLEPMDVVTLTDLDSGYDHEAVRVTSITEDTDGVLQFEAEEAPVSFQGASIVPAPTNPTTPDDFGGIIVGGMWTRYQTELDNPVYVDLAGGMISDIWGPGTDVPPKFVFSATQDRSITSMAVTYTRRERDIRATDTDVTDVGHYQQPCTAIIRIRVDGTSYDIGPVPLKFSYYEVGATKLMLGDGIPVPQGSAVAVEISYYDDGGALVNGAVLAEIRDSSGTLTGYNGPLYLQQCFNWTISWEPA